MASSPSWLDTVPPRAFAGILWLPWAITLCFAAAGIVRNQRTGAWGKQYVISQLAWYLVAWQGVLYLLQWTLAAPRPSPFDPTGTAIFYGYPSETGFYTAVLVTFIVLFTFAVNAAFSPLYWAGLVAVLAFVPSFLIWCGFNTWQETAVSVGLGTLSITFYILCLWFLVKDSLPITLNSVPWTWTSTIDTWLRSEEQIQATDDIAACLERIRTQRAPRPRHAIGWLWDSLY